MKSPVSRGWSKLSDGDRRIFERFAANDKARPIDDTIAAIKRMLVVMLPGRDLADAGASGLAADAAVYASSRAQLERLVGRI